MLTAWDFLATIPEKPSAEKGAAVLSTRPVPLFEGVKVFRLRSHSLEFGVRLQIRGSGGSSAECCSSTAKTQLVSRVSTCILQFLLNLVYVRDL